MKTGIIDEPVNYSKNEDDKLGIKDYAYALKTFIENTETPMTIGVQGEWGSGKTSLMNRLWMELKGDDKNTEIECIWINTWEHSLLKSPEETLISIVGDITNQISSLNPKNTNFTKLKDTGKKLFSGAAKFAAGMASGVAGKEVIEDILDSKADNSIKQLKKTLENFINETIQDKDNSEIDKISKLVFYIDDLDRIEPKDAVKILELLKNIFSLPYCVFILAIDYQVVIKGLKDKFGDLTENNEREFRSFFDKIIQLPFVMPVSSYSTGEYVLSLLKDINFTSDNKYFDEDLINQIVEFSVGTNPRAIKRLTNSLSLMNILDKQKKNNSIQDISKYKLLLFYIVCCQVAYPKVYDIILENPDIVNTWNDDLAFEVTQKKEEQDINFNSSFEEIKKQEFGDERWEQCLYRICFADINLKSNFFQVVNFIKILIEDENNLENNMGNLQEVLKTSSATAVTVKKYIQENKSKKQDNFEGSYNYIKNWWLATNDNEIVEKRMNSLKYLHEIFSELQNENEDLKIQYSNATISLLFKNKKISSSYNIVNTKKPPKLKDDKIPIGMFKDIDNNYRLPKLSEKIIGKHIRNFKRDSEDIWRYSESYSLHIGLEDLKSYRKQVVNLILSSLEVIKENKKLLKIDKNKTYNQDDLNDLEEKANENYTYNVKL